MCEIDLEPIMGLAHLLQLAEHREPLLAWLGYEGCFELLEAGQEGVQDVDHGVRRLGPCPGAGVVVAPHRHLLSPGGKKKQKNKLVIICVCWKQEIVPRQEGSMAD